MTRTTIIPLISRKMAPFVLLFGCYLISHGHLSPGGGFQGGTVLASGILLLALGAPERIGMIGTKRSSKETRGNVETTPLLKKALGIAEAIGFTAFLVLGLAGMLFATGFLADPFPDSAWFPLPAPLSDWIPDGPVPHPWFIFLLNLAIGLKVGSGISLVCLSLLAEET